MKKSSRKLKKQKLIGITGSIGSGKSTVAKFFREWGAKVIDADEIAHTVIQKPEVVKEIVNTFGKNVLNSDGKINRKKLGKLVFADPTNLDRLNQIMRVPILKEFETAVNLNEEPILVVDAPLLFEYGLQDLFDYIVVVSTSINTSIERFVKRTGYPRELAQKIVEFGQIQLDEKKKKADFVIENNGTLEELKRNAYKVWKIIVSDP